MRGVNKVILVGHLGKDPEFQMLEGNVSLARVTLATSESYKDKNGEVQTRTDWHNLVFWRVLAEQAQRFLKKGSLVYVEGKLRNREWEDKDKVKRYAVDVQVDTFTMLDRKKDGLEYDGQPTGANNDGGNTQMGGSTTTIMADDLPF